MSGLKVIPIPASASLEASAFSRKYSGLEEHLLPVAFLWSWSASWSFFHSPFYVGDVSNLLGLWGYPPRSSVFSNPADLRPHPTGLPSKSAPGTPDRSDPLEDPLSVARARMSAASIRYPMRLGLLVWLVSSAFQVSFLCLGWLCSHSVARGSQGL